MPGRLSAHAIPADDQHTKGVQTNLIITSGVRAETQIVWFSQRNYCCVFVF